MSADARRRDLTSIDDRTHRENRVRSAYIAGIFLLSIPLAYLAPAVAPYLWLVLFLDPSRRLVGRRSAADEEGDRLAGPGTGD
jgi:hypothetical protein